MDCRRHRSASAGRKLTEGSNNLLTAATAWGIDHGNFEWGQLPLHVVENLAGITDD